MKCPACGRVLNPVEVSNIIVEFCSDGCAGIWFERGKLDRLADPADPAGDSLAAMSVHAQVLVDVTQRRRCPTCPDSVLMRHFFSAKRAVTIDERPPCAGVWLDAGELEQIRAEHPSADSRRQAARISAEEALNDERMALIDTQMREQLPLNISRSRYMGSLLVLAYFVVALRIAGAGTAFRILSLCVLPWSCVMFPETLGSVMNPVWGWGTMKPTPRRFVWFFGWLLLVLLVIPIAIILIR